ncbi:MAG TPA: DUF262 domain-containing protein [Actinocrinis sp.]|jgi:hypothetical protein
MAQPTRMVVKPEIILLEDLLAEVREGRLRVPHFQRPFVWRPEQMTQLFESIEKGYPIGSLLIWETTEALRSLSRVAGVDVPAPAPGSQVSYLLDGHQRISTLFGTLTKRPESPAPEAEWLWRVYRVLGTGEDTDAAGGAEPARYQHWRRSQAPRTNYLPMSAVLRTLDFLAYSRTVAADDRADADRLITEAERVAQRIKSCQLAVVRLRGGSLEQAVDVFSRVNSTGQPMTPEQMVSALTYDEASEGSLLSRIELISEGLAEQGYGAVNPTTIFRTILAVSGVQDVMRSSWSTLAQEIKPGLDDDVKRAETALYRTVEFLKDDVGVPLGRLVPYQHQIMTLATFFGLLPQPSPETTNELVRWFWGTSWSGYFAGANTTTVRDTLNQMRDFAHGKVRRPWDQVQARALPQCYTLASARIKSFLIWQFVHFKPQLGSDGSPIDSVRILAASDWRALRQIVHGDEDSSPANRIIFPTPARVSVRAALKDLDPEVRDAVLAGHGIPISAYRALLAGDDAGFVRERAKSLIAAEQEFMRSMGIDPPAESDQGDDLNDSD